MKFIYIAIAMSLSAGISAQANDNFRYEFTYSFPGKQSDQQAKDRVGNNICLSMAKRSFEKLANDEEIKKAADSFREKTKQEFTELYYSASSFESGKSHLAVVLMAKSNSSKKYPDDVTIELGKGTFQELLENKSCELDKAKILAALKARGMSPSEAAKRKTEENEQKEFEVCRRDLDRWHDLNYRVRGNIKQFPDSWIQDLKSKIVEPPFVEKVSQLAECREQLAKEQGYFNGYNAVSKKIARDQGISEEALVIPLPDELSHGAK
ncbi:MAG: hypothetical protein ACXWQO_12690 [Bdellovibrionota bacterium]